MFKLPWSKPKIIVDSDTWSFYDRHLPGGLATVRYNTQKFDTGAYPHAFRLKYFLPAQQARDENLRYAVEEGVVKTLQDGNIDCRFMSVKMIISQEGTHFELLFHARDAGAFTTALETHLRNNPEIKIECSKQEGWDYFNEQVLPTAEDMNRMGDRDVINQMVKAGSDPLKPHTIELAFYGDAANLEKLRGRLVTEHYVQIEKGEHDSLVMTKPLPLDLEQINECTFYVMGLAKEFSVKFDGWGAAIVK